MRTVVIVPAFNEEAALPATLAELRVVSPDLDIVVVNDGSADGTGRVARESGVATVIELPANLGIGGAVQTGFKYAAREGYDYAIQVDADGQHQGAEIPKLLEPLLAGTADVVIGSRFLGAGDYRAPAARRLGMWLFYLINSLLVGRAITDNTSGFRAYNREAIAFLAEHYPADYPEPEAVILLRRNGFRLEEVGVSMRARQGGASSIGLRGAAYYMIKVVLAVLVTAFRAPVRR